MFIWSGSTDCPSLFSRGVYIFHDFAVTISGCFKDVCANSFFLRTGNFWNFLLMQCFPFPLTLTPELRNTSYLRIFLNELPLCFNLSTLLSLVTPCILEAVQSCMVWIPIKNGIDNFRSRGWETLREITALLIRIAEKTCFQSLCWKYLQNLWWQSIKV